MTDEGTDEHSCRLYLISPPAITLPAFTKQLQAALEAGDVGAFQLRLKEADDDVILEACAALLPICHAHEVAFILNDRPDLAFQAGADGVHLGQEDGTIAQARDRMALGTSVGVSCHDSMHLAMEAGDGGADYVAFGAFYPTQSKSPDKLARYGTPTTQILEWWSTYTVIPCVAIGGMTPQNCGPLVGAGADFIAAITAVWAHPKGPGEAVAEFNSAIAKALLEKQKNPQPA